MLCDEVDNIVEVRIDVVRVFTGFLQDTVTVELGSEPVEKTTAEPRRHWVDHFKPFLIK